MSRLRLDDKGQIAPVSIGQKAIEEAEGQIDPRVKEVVGNNEKLNMSALNQPQHDGLSIYNLLDDNDDELDGNQRELRDLSQHAFDSEVGQDSLDKMVLFLREKQSLAQMAADAVKNNPTLLSDVKDQILNTGVSGIDKASRVLNYFVAVESGAANGLIRSLKGEGTVLDGINESLEKNSGFGETLKELGVPEGAKGQLAVPRFLGKPLSPSQMIAGAVKDVLEGKDPAELRPFGPILTTRGAVGFGLDVLLDPLTYLSLGANTPSKVALKQGAKSIFRQGTNDLGAKSVVRFADKTLLTDKELLHGIAALKSTKAGHAILEAVDRFASFQFAKNVSLRDVTDNLARKFLPDYGMHKPTMDIFETADRRRMLAMDDAAKIVKSTFSDFSQDEKVKFAEEMFNRNRRESVFRRLKNRAAKRIEKVNDEAIKSGFASGDEAFKAFRNLSKENRKKLLRKDTFNKDLLAEMVAKTKKMTPEKMERIKALVAKRSVSDPTMMKLAKLSKGVLKKFRDLKFDPTQPVGLQKFSNPKFQRAAEVLVGKEGLVTNLAKHAGLPDEILYENYIPGIFEQSVGKVNNAKKKLMSTARFKKEFKIKSVDPENDYITRMAELITVGHTRRAIKKVLTQYGATYEQAMKEGFDEFFPRDAVKQFTNQKAFDRVEDLGLANQAEKVYLPKQILETIDELAKRQNIQSGALLKVMGAFTQQFKAYVTSIWPAFHARNAFSNQVLRFMNEGWKAFNLGTNADAFSMLIDSPRLGDTLIELGKGTGKKVPLRVVRKWAEAEGIRGTNQFMIDNGGRLLDQLSDREISGKLSGLFHPLATSNDMVKAGRSIGGFIEDHAKLTSFTQALKDGFSRKEAAQIAYQGLFDYGHLTSFEKSVMRRIFPFYTFTRKNIGLQMKTFLENPGRQGVVLKLMKDLRDDALGQLTPEQLEAFNEIKPNLTKRSFAVPAGFDSEGNPLWMTGFGLPQEDILDIFNAQGVFFRTNPLIKLPANEFMRQLDKSGVISFKEQYTMKEIQFLFNDVFTTRTSREKVKEWVNDPNGLAQHPLARFMGLKVVSRDVIKDGKPTGEKDFMFNADPRFLDVLRNTLIARHASTMRQFSDPNTEETTNFVRLITGLTIYEQNLGRALRSQAVETKQKVAEVYKQNGLGYLFNRPGVSKDADADLKRFNKRLGDF